MPRQQKISNETKYPNFYQEKKLQKLGYKNIVGLDESGRGPLAGPVIASTVVVNKSRKSYKSYKAGSIALWLYDSMAGIKDSKKLTPKKREEFYEIIVNHPAIEWGIGKVSEKIIDKINILEATKLAMRKAVQNLEKKLIKKYRILKMTDQLLLGYVDFLIIDGNFKIGLDVPQKSIIKADEKVFSVTLASIIAKVVRDRIMRKQDDKYPQYGFAQHKGYPTKYHRKMLKRYGPCKIHRRSFKPIRQIKIHLIASQLPFVRTQQGAPSK